MSTHIRRFSVVLAALLLAACGTNPPVEDGGTGGGTGGGGGGGGGGEVDVTAPTIRSTSPAAGATDQALDVTFVVAFSEAMRASSVSVSIAPVIALGTPVFDAEGITLTVTPSAALLPDTNYTVSIEGEDPAGNALDGLKAFTFHTKVVDVTAPTILNTVPANAAANVAVGSTIAILFSEPMNPGTVSIEVSPVADLGLGVWTEENERLTFTPAAPLAALTAYTFTLSGQDLAGNALTGSLTFSFTTGAPPDTTPPTVLDTTPGNGESGVSNNTLITLTFSEPMRQADTEGALSLRAGLATLTNCDARWLWNAQRTVISCQPNPALAFNTQHRVGVTPAAKDDAGNALAAEFTITFTTGLAPDTTPPTISSVSPVNLAVGIERNAALYVTFNETMDTTATQGAFSCTWGMGSPVGGTFSWGTRNTVLRFTPSALFTNGAGVACTVRGGSGGARDAAGNRLAATFTWSFRVLKLGTLTLPSVPAIDGYAFNTGSAYATTALIYAGDNSSNLAARSFFTFDLAGLPSETRRVTGATLYVYFVGAYGVPSTLGSLYLDHLVYGATLTASDYSASALSTSIWSTTLVAGTHAISVTSAVQDDLSNRLARGNRTQFRVRFATEVTSDNASDGVVMAASEWGPVDQRPDIHLNYEYP